MCADRLGVPAIPHIRLVSLSLIATAVLAAAVLFPSPAGSPVTGTAVIGRVINDDAPRLARSLASSSHTPSDPLWADAWSLRTLNVPDVWDLADVWGLDAAQAPTVVAVVDTGVDAAQSDLAGALVNGFDGFDSTGTMDDNGHGTLVAGIIGARSNNRIGVTSVCWSCSIMPIKVMNASGIGESTRIAAGIRWAADHGARVINLSFVMDGPQQIVGDALQYAHERGVVIVGAAGNTGGSDPTYPAAYPEVIGVAAAQADGVLYPWSQHGPWVDVTAPGCSPSTAPHDVYTTFCGTSSATAVVSGVAGLALSTVPEATNADLERALRQTAVRTGEADVAYGRVDARALVDDLRAAIAGRVAPA